MQTISLSTTSAKAIKNERSVSVGQWYQRMEPVLEENRFGVVAALVLLQVSIAGFNVVLPAMAGASIWIMTPGIAMAFISNSIAFAQMRMNWVMAAFALSMLVNAATSIYYFAVIAAA
jgi:hypothetical protein